MGRYTSGGVGRDIFAGALAGVAAIWVADQLDRALYAKGSPDAIRKTEAARPGGMDPAHVLAKRAADTIGADIGDPKDNPAGHTVHYGIAAGMGALYGLLRGMTPGVTTARGAMFGVALFVLKDEIGNTMMGTAGNPLKYPVRDHARGAAAHTLFGVVTDLVTRIISPWRDKVVIEQGPPISERLDQGRNYLTQQRDYVYGQGRSTLDQARSYLNQGINQGITYAGQLAEQARARLPDVDPDAIARQSRRYATQTVQTARASLPDYDDAAAYAKTGIKRTRRFAEDVMAQAPEIPTSGLSRALKRIIG